MATMSRTDAFHAFGARLANRRWAYSAIADDGSLVLSCWSHRLTKLPAGGLRYTDRLSRWTTNRAGKNLLIEHLSAARDQDLPVRLVIATTDQPEVVDRGEDASAIRNTFHIKEDVVGKIILFDGDELVLEFRPR